MNIKEFFSSDNKAHWINKMKECDWGAGQWLAELLTQNKLQEKGEKWKSEILVGQFGE